MCSWSCSVIVTRINAGCNCCIKRPQHVPVQVTPAMLEFFRVHTSGFICVGMEGARLDELQLPLMVCDCVLMLLLWYQPP